MRAPPGVVAALLAAITGTPAALAQPTQTLTPGAALDDEPVQLETAVAEALVERGWELFRAGDQEHARALSIEALERDPDGPHASAARTLLREANARLGRPADDGTATTVEHPLDPYRASDPVRPSATLEPVDPYQLGAREASFEDVSPDGLRLPDRRANGAGARRARLELAGWAAAYGLAAGIGVSDSGAAAVPVGVLGAAAAAGASWLITSRRALSLGQTSAIEGVGTWAAVDAAFLAQLASGDEPTDGFGVWRAAAVGGALGIAGGTWFALAHHPSVDDVAVANSLAGYGTAAGLLLGVAIDPAKVEAYSLQGLIGATAGFGGGLVAARYLDLSRERTWLIDLGALAGLATSWGLAYPLMADGGTRADERVAGGLSVVTMGAGATLAWYWTREMAGEEASDVVAGSPSAAVMQRDARGRWRLGAPMPRPMHDPRLAPPTRGLCLGADLLAGRF